MNILPHEDDYAQMNYMNPPAGVSAMSDHSNLEGRNVGLQGLTCCNNLDAHISQESTCPI